MIFGQKYRGCGMCVTNILRIRLSVKREQVKKVFLNTDTFEDGEEERIAGAGIYRKKIFETCSASR